MVEFQAELKREFGKKILPVEPDKLHLTIQGGIKEEEAFKAEEFKTTRFEVEVSNVNWDIDIGILWEVKPVVGDKQIDAITQRRTDWAKQSKYPPHITVGYFAQPFSQGELARLREIISRYQDNLGYLLIDKLQVIQYTELSFNAGYRVIAEVNLRQESFSVDKSILALEGNTSAEKTNRDFLGSEVPHKDVNAVIRDGKHTLVAGQPLFAVAASQAREFLTAAKVETGSDFWQKLQLDLVLPGRRAPPEFLGLVYQSPSRAQYIHSGWQGEKKIPSIYIAQHLLDYLKENLPENLFKTYLTAVTIHEAAELLGLSHAEAQALHRKYLENQKLIPTQLEALLISLTIAHALQLSKVSLSHTAPVLVFDVDETILDRKENTFKTDPEITELFIELLSLGFKAAIISGNSRSEQTYRIVQFLKEGLAAKGRVDLMTNFILYVNGGATRVTYNKDGEETIQAIVQPIGYREELIEAIEEAVQERMSRALGFEGRQGVLAVEELKRWVSFDDGFGTLKDFPNCRLDVRWLDGEAIDITVVDPGEIAARVYGIINEPLELSFPWIEDRDGAQLSIKPVPNLAALNGELIDIRPALVDEIEAILFKKGLGGRFTFRPAGFASIDVSEQSADKSMALKDLMGYLAVTAEDVVYFGNEFFRKGTKEGNDVPTLKVAGLTVVAVNKDPRELLSLSPEEQSRLFWLGSGPAATKEFLGKVLSFLERGRRRAIDVFRINYDKVAEANHAIQEISEEGLTRSRRFIAPDGSIKPETERDKTS